MFSVVFEYMAYVRHFSDLSNIPLKLDVLSSIFLKQSVVNFALQNLYHHDRLKEPISLVNMSQC